MISLHWGSRSAAMTLIAWWAFSAALVTLFATRLGAALFVLLLGLVTLATLFQSTRVALMVASVAVISLGCSQLATAPHALDVGTPAFYPPSPLRIDATSVGPAVLPVSLLLATVPIVRLTVRMIAPESMKVEQPQFGASAAYWAAKQELRLSSFTSERPKFRNLRFLAAVTSILAAAVGSGAAIAAGTRINPLAAAAAVIAIPLVGLSLGLFVRQLVDRQLPPAAVVGSFLCAASSILITLNGLRATSNASLADCLLLATAACFMASAAVEAIRWPPLPAWSKIGALLLVLAVILSTAAARDPTSSASRGLLFLGALIATPPIVAVASSTRQTVVLMSTCWLFSGAVNGLVALLDTAGISRFGRAATGFSFLDRSAGLSSHPNHLGISCAMLLPVGLVLLTTAGNWRRRAGLGILTAGVSLGVVLSGSRAAIAGVAIGLFVTLLLAHGQRRSLGALTAVCLTTAAAALVVNASSLTFVGFQRLSGQTSVGESDAVRAALHARALDDFGSSPLLGVGFDAARDAHDVYLQLLQSGGLFALLAFAIFVLGALRTGWNRTRDDHLPRKLQLLGAAFTGSIVAWLAMGAASNEIYDRYIYWPFGLILALSFIAAVDAGRYGPQSDFRLKAQTLPHDAANSVVDQGRVTNY